MTTHDNQYTDASKIPSHLINQVHQSDALDFTQKLPDNCIHSIITSPPYFNVRDYQVDGQYGLEATPAAYVETLVTLFRECKRVLRNDGTFWLNIGDVYNSNRNNNQGTGLTPDGSKYQWAIEASGITGLPDHSLPEKNLLLIPHRLAIALQDDGWIVRQDNVWAKDAPMPESVQDRTTRAHEYIFHLVKQGDYYYDADAIREPYNDAVDMEYRQKLRKGSNYTLKNAKNYPRDFSLNTGRNKRSVWRLKSEPFSGPHYATFPSELPRTCILAGCPERCCPICGVGWVREVEATGGTIGQSWHPHEHDAERGMMQDIPSLGNATNGNGEHYQRIDKGFHPACTCNAPETLPGVVYDPFAGSGTTLLVARQLGRTFIGCDISQKYVDIARDRLRQPFEPRRVKVDNDLSGLPLFKTLTGD